MTNKKIIREIKMIRRTVKNRLYAKKGRDKRDVHASMLEGQHCSYNTLSQGQIGYLCLSRHCFLSVFLWSVATF